MKYYFPIHFNGGNRGCEAIAKGTAILLKEPKENLIGLCSDVNLDKRLGIDNYVTLQAQKKDLSLFEKIIRKVYNLFVKDARKRRFFTFSFLYNPFLKQISNHDVLLSSGGDVMCYDENQAVYTTNYAKKRGIKTVLWGCSMGPQNLTEKKLVTLKNFDLVYTRETLSEEFFRSLGLTNICLFPDPAFILQPEEVSCTEMQSTKGIIGLNLSEFVLGAYNLETPFGRQVKELIDYIIQSTEFDLVLIPHVTWEYQDDILVANNVKSLYKNNPRVRVIDTMKYNYCQLRYIISKCRVFIGGRTHAVISAYSTCVPAIAIGYSIKSRGIAKDLGLTEQFVVDSKHVSEHNQLLASLKYVINNEVGIRTHMINTIPSYKKRLDGLKDFMTKFLNK